MEKNDPLKNMPYMSPLTNREEASRVKGFTENFEVQSANSMINTATREQYAPADVAVVNHYRFEGMSDPGDNNVLYEIVTSDGKQGILVTPYGPDCPAHVADFVAAIPQIEKQRAGTPLPDNDQDT